MKNKGFFGLSTGMCCECETGIGEIARGKSRKCMKYKRKRALACNLLRARIVFTLLIYYLLLFIIIINIFKEFV